MSIDPQKGDKQYSWLNVAKRLQAIAQAGLTFCENAYDRERYEEIRDISIQMIVNQSDTDFAKVKQLFASGHGYQTPMVDIRAVVFDKDKILMVKEKADGRWSLPGGWADVGYSPAEVAVKETREEAGLAVDAIRLLGVFDKKFHPHPPEPYYVYKLFILCNITGGNAIPGIETSDVQFFSRHELPALSEERNTGGQIELMFEFLDNPSKTVYFE